ATLTITDKNVAANAPATAYIDATGAYADFGPIFTMVNGTKGDLKTKYSATFKNDENQNINLVDTINSSIDNAFKTTVAAKLVELERKMAEKNSKDKKDNKPADSNTPSESSGESNEGGSDFMSFVMDVAKGFGSADDKIDYACSVVYPFIEKVDSAATGFLPDLEGGKKGTATQATVIKYAFERELADTNSCIADYALFYQNATTFEGLWNNIKACHTAGKAALTAATNAGNGKAGVQFFDPATEENDLLDYIAHFVKVPTIVEGEPNFENPGAINNAENLKDWLNWIFPVDNEYRDMVEDILGLGLVEIIDGGIYFEAINLGGFNGAVRAAASNAEGAVEYVSLSAGFGMKASAADNMAAIEAEVEFNAQNEGEYYIAVMAEELLDALCAYGHN
ncbi:MAG: hypothetical protein J5781_07975, partial [Clostridia bacterium]|nr:hypothetical protein [Clostridia bacterium]